MYVSVPFLTNTHLDFNGLNNIVAYDTYLSKAMMIHLSCMLVIVMTMMSSINLQLNGRRISVFALVHLFAALIIMLKP